VKRFQNRSDVFEFWSLDNSLNKSILDVLETIYLKFRKPIVQRVTVVKFGVYILLRAEQGWKRKGN